MASQHTRQENYGSHTITYVHNSAYELAHALISFQNRLPHPQYNLSHVIVSDVIDRIYYVINFVSKTLILKRPVVAIFTDIIKKILTMSIKTIFKDSRKVKIEIMYQNATYICIS